MEIAEPLRVLIVDDSRIFRGILQSALELIPGVKVVGSVFTGEKGLEFLNQQHVDLVTLDVEMPGLGGLGALREITRRNRERIRSELHSNSPIHPINVLLVSALTQKGSMVAVEGLQLGAFDFLCKPSESSEEANRESLRLALLEKIEILKASRRTSRGRALPIPVAPKPPVADSKKGQGNFRAIAIGTSTGGPEALGKILPTIAASCDAPIFIVQHILDGLSQYLAQSLSKKCGRPVLEATDHMKVEPGGIYLAKSGKHMVLRSSDGSIRIGTTTAPPEKGFRPSIDIFLRSASATYGSSLVAAILTGMLDDGAEGVRVVKRNGGFVIVQDEPSCVVATMPLAALATGSVDQVVPIAEMANFLVRLFDREGRL